MLNKLILKRLSTESIKKQQNISFATTKSVFIVQIDAQNKTIKVCHEKQVCSACFYLFLDVFTKMPSFLQKSCSRCKKTDSKAFFHQNQLKTMKF